MDEKKYLTVTALNRYIAYKIDNDFALKSIYIKGEISNARFSKGHLYFVLKDEESEISAIMFASIAQTLNFVPEDGLKVLITASVNCYPKKGTYNLVVNKMEEYGKGLIYQRFIELKNKLESLGLFAPEHKKTIPHFPNTIGVITSNNGDAIKDIISTINKRYPICDVRIYNALVQGPDAPKSLIEAIKLANSENICDVLIIGRGGGAIEDLDCFNDPDLAYAIYDSAIPMISGVGHENDYTICDFVSDLRAPTPTGAAVPATTDKNIIFENINNMISHLNSYYKQILTIKYNEYSNYLTKLKATSPENIIEKQELSLNAYIKRLSLYNIDNKINGLENDISKLEKDLNNYYLNSFKSYTNKFQSVIDKLILVNPLNIMNKGYTLVYKDKKLIKSKEELHSRDEVSILFNDGEVSATIK